MAALPSAFWCHASRPFWIDSPLVWMAKSTMVVVPPWAAAMRARLEVVGRGGAAERHVEVRVGVDAAGDHVFAGRVDDHVGGAEIHPSLRDGGDHAPSIQTSAA
jgi:hypothetical protein